MESLQLVGCLWSIGLIGLDIELPKIKSYLDRTMCDPQPLPRLLQHTPRCPRGSQRSSIYLQVAVRRDGCCEDVPGSGNELILFDGVHGECWSENTERRRTSINTCKDI